MERNITTHHGNTLNDSIELRGRYETPDGAMSEYWMFGRSKGDLQFQTGLKFQTGNPADEINGISNEVLLAIVRDRLEGFQSGPFACDKNRHALVQVIGAMSALQDRTAERVERGVEGTQTL